MDGGENVKECAVEENVVEESGDEVEVERVRKSKRECPVPKPPGIIGEILGFRSSGSSTTTRAESSSSEGKGSRPP